MLVRKKQSIVEAEQFFVAVQPWPAGVYQIQAGIHYTEDMGHYQITLPRYSVGERGINPPKWWIPVGRGERIYNSSEIRQTTVAAIDKRSPLFQKAITEYGWPADVYDRLHFINCPLGKVIVTDGDWIITDVMGERFACKNEVFVRTYEEVL